MPRNTETTPPIIECNCPDCQNLNEEETEEFYQTIAQEILDNIEDITREERERRNRERDLNETIKQYNAKISNVPIGEDPDGMFLGVELEVYTAQKDRRLVAKEILEIFDSYKDNKYVLTKRDGSIRDERGFELITRPLSLEKHYKFWDKFFDKVTDIHEHDSCGMHVHISRKPLSKTAVANIVMFVNTHINNKFIETVADRKSNNYTQVYEKDWEWINQDTRKYESVNITNRHTIEFRIFSCKLDKKIIYARLEFCRALAEYAMQDNSKLSDLSWRTFVVWLENNEHKYEYNYLKTFIRENLCF